MSNFSSDIIYLHPDQIQINRPQRQRTEIDTTDLIDSIREIGVINPVIVKRVPCKDTDLVCETCRWRNGHALDCPHGSYLLVAGERRLESCRKLNIKVSCRLISDNTDAEIIELEENLKRQNLSWRDESRTIAKLHNKHLESNPTHTIDNTAKSLSLSKTHITNCLTVAKYLDLKLLNNANSINQAIGLLTRFHLDQIETISAVIANNPLPDYLIPDPKPTPEPTINTANLIAAFDLEPTPHTNPTERGEAPRSGAATNGQQGNENTNSTTLNVEVVPSLTPPESLIKNQDIKSFILESEGGPGFNFIHLDLIMSDLINFMNHRHITEWLEPKSHVMVWFEFENYYDVLELMTDPDCELDIEHPPLIWFKPDIKEYEPALIFSYRSDKKLNLRPYIYPAPTSQISTDKKPESMLRFFFSKIMNKDTNFFDPYCGNGASLRAADSIGVNSILGLEPNPDLCLKGNELIQRDRLLRKRF